MTCIIHGDSIAQGVAMAMRDQCAVVARVGASSAEIGRMPLPTEKGWDQAIVSAGSNDPRNPLLPQTIAAIRDRLDTPTVWILPRNRRAAYVVRKACIAYGDKAVDLVDMASNDGVHPRSYRELAIAVAQAKPCS